MHCSLLRLCITFILFMMNIIFTGSSFWPTARTIAERLLWAQSWSSSWPLPTRKKRSLLKLSCENAPWWRQKKRSIFRLVFVQSHCCPVEHGFAYAKPEQCHDEQRNAALTGARFVCCSVSINFAELRVCFVLYVWILRNTYKYEFWNWARCME